MAKNSKPAVELVPYTRQDEAHELKRILTHLVEEKVAEATGGPEAIFQPFFQTPKLAHEIKRLQSVPEQRKFHHYYEKWGCLAGCGATKETTAHYSLGMCQACYRRIRGRLLEIVREQTPVNAGSQDFRDSVRLAKAALDPAIRLLPPAEIEKRRFYTQQEACKAAGIDPKTLYRWLRDGDVRPSVRVTDKRFLWTDADVEELKMLKSKNASHHGSAAAKARWGKS